MRVKSKQQKPLPRLSSRLNEHQLKVVLETERNCLALASPGAGKTRVLTYKIVHLLDKGVNPGKILALTFTNKAAREMKKRARELHPHSSDVALCTFHSYCLRLLRSCGHTYTVINEDDSKGMIKELHKADSYSIPFERAYHLISFAGNFYSFKRGLTGQLPIITQEVTTLYDEYVEHLHKNNCIDFNLIIRKVVNLLGEHPELATFDHVLVDEWQDTSDAQFELLRRFKSPRITVLGDDDQCIYEWRGADFTNTKRFIEEFNPATFPVPGNYRSATEIIDKCNRLISYNKNRIEKRIESIREEKGDTELRRFNSGQGEADYVIESAMRAVRRGVPPDQIAVLFRISSLSMDLEQACARYHLPYELIGSFSFFDRMEVKTMIALLNFMLNPKSLHNLVYFSKNMKLGITSKRWKKIEYYIEKDQLERIEEPRRPEHFWKNRVVQVFKARREPNISDPMIAHKTAEVLGYYKLLKERDVQEKTDRSQNVHRFCEHVKGLVGSRGNLQAAMDDIMLTTKADQETEDNKIKLMTIHAAKGLEFEIVYVVGMEEGILPHRRCMGEKDLEGERRLAFVAMSRAKDRLVLTAARMRKIWTYVSASESRFIKEIT